MREYGMFGIICIALLAIILLINPIEAQAEVYGDLIYEISNGEVTITNCSESASGVMEIPSTIDGYPVTSIGQEAFYACYNLSVVTIPESVTSIGTEAFGSCDSLTSVFIGNGVLSIGEGAFRECHSLSSVVIGNSVINIDVAAFYCCSSLKSVTIPDSVTNIGAHAFHGCESLSSVIIGSNVNEIGDRAFAYCLSLESIAIPGSVTNIGNEAFYYCTGLTSITIPDSVTSIGNDAFFYCADLTGIWVDTDNPNYSNDAYGCLFNKNKTTLIQAPGKLSGSYEIINGVTFVGDYAFFFCDGLTWVSIPDSVVRIGDFAFYNCTGLTSITIPDSVTSIGNAAFFYCTGLTGIWVDADNQNYSSDAYGCLFNQNKTTLIWAPEKLSGSYVIPDSVTSIGRSAFNCTDLTSVTIPDSVTSIGDGAFDNCSQLSTIVYCGTEPQWNAIDIGKSNTPLTSAARQYHSGDQWEIVQMPTCTEPGLRTRICEICGEIQQEEIPALLGSVTVDKTLYPYPESSHNYANNTKETKIFTYAGAKSLTITFSAQSQTETNYDKVYILDKSGTQIAMYTGSLANQTVTIPGDTFQVRLTSDGSVNKWGYSFSSIVAEMDSEHTWGDWSQAKAPTCTEAGEDGRMCSFCNTQEIRSGAAATGHSFEQGQCAVCGLGENPVGGYVNGTYTGYNDLASAIAAGGWVKLFEYADVSLSLTADLYIDLNGYDLSGTVTTNGYKICGMDSTTDGYTCETIGYFNCVDENGKEIVPVTHFKSDMTGATKRYMAIKTDEGYSFHRFYLGITHQTLKPTTAGVGYKGVFYGDSMVAANLDGFGFTMQLGNYSPKTVTKDASSFVSGKTVTLRIDNFDVDNYGETDLYVSVMLKLSDGMVIESTQCTMTMRGLLEQLNSNYSALTTDQLATVADMIKKYTTIQSWKVENLIL